MTNPQHPHTPGVPYEAMLTRTQHEAIAAHLADINTSSGGGILLIILIVLAIVCCLVFLIRR